MNNLDKFIQAIKDKNKVRVKFYSKEDADVLERVCAPMDYGPSRRAHDKSDRYHLWDYESDTACHTLSLLPGQVISITVMDENFDPAEFITWDVGVSPWFVERDWGIYS